MEKLAEGVFWKKGSTNSGILMMDGVAYVIDTGSSVKFAKELISEIEGEELVVLNTHSHADHIQGNRLFEKAGAKIFADEREVPFIRDTVLESSALYGATPPKALRYSFYRAKPSNAVSLEKADLPDSVKAIGLSGHSHGMTAFETEGIVFCGDAYFSKEILEKYGYPYLTDVGKFFGSLQKLEKTDAKLFVPAHGEPKADPTPDVSVTKSKVREFIDAAVSELDTPKSVEKMCFGISEKKNISLNTGTFYLFRSFLSAVLSYLEDEKLAIQDGLPGMWKRV